LSPEFQELLPDVIQDHPCRDVRRRRNASLAYIA
jgi:hypothetical protein